jgi:hypothetical protein
MLIFVCICRTHICYTVCPQAILELNVVQPILEVVFHLMSLPPANEKKEQYFSGYVDASTLMACAAQILDNLVLYLPPEKILPLLVCHITVEIFTHKNKNYSMSHIIQTSSGAHPASYPVGTQGSFPGVKWLVREAHTIHLHLVLRSRVHGCIHPLLHTLSWHSASLVGPGFLCAKNT